MARINTLTTSCIELDEERYPNSAKSLSDNADVEQLKLCKLLLEHMTHSRPELSSPVMNYVQVTKKTLPKTHKKEFSDSINTIVTQLAPELKYQPLDLNFVTLKIYTDADFAPNGNRSPQTGSFINLCNINRACHIIAFSSTKSCYVVCLIVKRELLVFDGSNDYEYDLSHDLQITFNCKIQL